MEIQIATEVNISDAGLVHSKSWQDSHKGIVEEKFLITRTPYRQTEYFKKEIQVYGNEVYILYDNELPIGVLSLNVPNGEIKSLYICPDNQGKGNGKDMLEYGINRLKEKKKIFLIVMNVNNKARKFYEKNGFLHSGKEKILSKEKGLSELEYIYCARK